MSIDKLRLAMMLSLAEQGWSAEVTGPVVLAVHPFDDAPAPSRAYEKAVRPLARSFAKEMASWPKQDAGGAKRRAAGLLEQYRDLAIAHGESPHFVRRFDQALSHARPGSAPEPKSRAAAPALPGRLGELSDEWVSLQREWVAVTGRPLPKVDVMTPAEPMSIAETEQALERLSGRAASEAELIAKWEAKVAAFRSQLAETIAPPAAPAAAAPVSERIAELKEIAALLEAGHITEAEFDRLKREVLAAERPPTPVPSVSDGAVGVQQNTAQPPGRTQGPEVQRSDARTPAPGRSSNGFETDSSTGFALRSGVGLTAALAWTATFAVAVGAIAAAADYRQAFQAWAAGGGRSRLDTLVQSEETLAAWGTGVRAVGVLALLFTIIWLYQVAKRVPDGPSPGSMIWSWFIPAANLILVPVKLGRLSERCTRRGAGKTLREAAAWAAPAGVIAVGVANVFTAENFPTAGTSTPQDQLERYFNAHIWLAIAWTITPLALAVFTWSLRRVGSLAN